VISLRGGHAVTGRAGSAERDALGPAVLALAAAAWVLLLVAQVTGSASLMHEHGAPAAALPPLVALASFLVSWQLMVVATMLPASLPSILGVAAATERRLRPAPGAAAFLAGFVSLWAAVGLLAFLAGQAVAGIGGASTWLEARPWLVQASVIAIAGAYQFTGIKRRSLAACRHPERLVGRGPAAAGAVYGVGLRHGLACFGSAWALMAVMVVAGFGDLWWMAVLAGVMVYEAIGRHGQRLAAVVGLLLLWLSAVVLLPGWLPT
jgi:predicted metal-binding membrane protein